MTKNRDKKYARSALGNKGKRKPALTGIALLDYKFQCIDIGERATLKDQTSEAKARIYIRAESERVYYSQPDKDLISEQEGKRCDYVCVTLQNKQVSFIELKGEKIATEGKDSPFQQIADTIDYFQNHEEYNPIMQNAIRFAFITAMHKFRLQLFSQTQYRQKMKMLAQKLGRTGQIYQVVVDGTAGKEYLNCDHVHPVNLPVSYGRGTCTTCTCE